MDLNFEQLLASHNQEFREAEVFNNWMPPDGEYIVSLVKLTTGASSKDGKDLMWWNLKGRIEDVQDEKLNGEEFTAGYFTSRAFGILKGAAKVLAGRDIIDLAEANAILEASIGSVTRVEIRTSRSKKNGQEYTNCYIKQVIDITDTTSAKDVSNMTTPAPIEEAQNAGIEAFPSEAPSNPDDVPL